MIKEKAAPNGNGIITHCKNTNNIRYCKTPAVKHLEKLADEAARQKYPNTPPQWLAPRRFRDDSANGLTKCILTFLRIKGHQAERINSTGRIVDKRKTFTDVVGRRRTIGQYEWVYGTGTRGTADISATIAGKSVKIEVKIGSDRQSQAQHEYQKAVEQAGGIYFIATSFEQFYQWYLQTFTT
jgi:hypothetical protein